MENNDMGGASRAYGEVFCGETWGKETTGETETYMEE
jgi:hypothetical protein